MYRLYQPETRTSKYINKTFVCWPAHILKDLHVRESLVVVDGGVARNSASSLAETCVPTGLYLLLRQRLCIGVHIKRVEARMRRESMRSHSTRAV